MPRSVKLDPRKLVKRQNMFVSQLRPLCRGTAPGGVYTTPGEEREREREVQKDGDPPNARIAAFHPPLICGPPCTPALYCRASTSTRIWLALVGHGSWYQFAAIPQARYVPV
jgi:hypothetical protein